MFALPVKSILAEFQPLNKKQGFDVLITKVLCAEKEEKYSDRASGNTEDILWRFRIL